MRALPAAPPRRRSLGDAGVGRAGHRSRARAARWRDPCRSTIGVGVGLCRALAPAAVAARGRRRACSRPALGARAEAGLHPIEPAHVREVVTLVSDPSPTLGGVRALIRVRGAKARGAGVRLGGRRDLGLAGRGAGRSRGHGRGQGRRATVGCGSTTWSACSRRRRPSGSAPELRHGARPTGSAACSSEAPSRSLRVRGRCSAASCSATIATSRRPCPTTSGPPGSRTSLRSRARTWRSSWRCSLQSLRRLRLGGRWAVTVGGHRLLRADHPRRAVRPAGGGDGRPGGHGEHARSTGLTDPPAGAGRRGAGPR